MSDRYNQHMSEPTLKTHFTASTRDDWLALVDKGLRGAAYESLIHKTEDGIPRGPLMTAADLPPHLAPLARTETSSSSCENSRTSIGSSGRSVPLQLSMPPNRSNEKK